MQDGDETSAKAVPLEIPVLPAVERASTDETTDIYNLKVQVGPEHAFPVIELDVPVAEASPLAHHFSEFAPQEGNRNAAAADGQGVPAAGTALRAAASTLPLADKPTPVTDEATTVAGSAETLDALVPVVDVEEAAKPEEAFLASAARNNATLDDADVDTGLPSSAAKEVAAVEAASAGNGVCGVTDGGIADTTAAFGVVDLSEIMARAITDAPASEATATGELDATAPAATSRGARPSQSPGRKGYITAAGDAASAATSEAAEASGGGGQTEVSLSASAEPRAAAVAADPYAVSPPEDNPTKTQCSPNKKDCVIS